MRKLSKSPRETFALGKEIGKKLRPGDVVALMGDLGGGKTVFTKGLGKALGVKEMILSPTFTISKIYSSKIPLAHFDFYRIEELDQNLIREVLDIINSGSYVTVIEWADRIIDYLPKRSKIIKFHHRGENEREVEIHTRY